jgi:hypothetical protein
MTEHHDWLRVVYGRGLDPEANEGEASSNHEIVVRQAPRELDLGSAPRREQLVRVTVLPSDPGQRWALWLVELAPAELDGNSRIWWRIEPGTWQPLGPTGQCVAEGRGRVRLDVSLRLRGRAPATAPQLRFVAEPAVG